MAPPENEKAEAQAPVPSNAELKLELTHHTDQLTKLWDETTKQSKQLVKLEGVPDKLDQLLNINIALASLQQTQMNQGQTISELKTVQGQHETRLTEGSKKFSYYAGAMAVAGLIFGIVVWMGEQAVTGAFSELSSIHGTIQSLQQDVKLLQFQMAGNGQPRAKP